MNFDGPLIITYDAKASRILDGDYWRVLKSFRYYIPASALANDCTATNKKEWVFISAGMLTDLGTVPKVLRGAVNEQGQASPAYVVHDQLCEYLSITVDGAPKLITRQEADLILLAALKDCGVDKTLAYLTYNAVAAYQFVQQITDPTTTAIKRRLEAEYNYEDFQ